MNPCPIQFTTRVLERAWEKDLPPLPPGSAEWITTMPQKRPDGSFTEPEIVELAFVCPCGCPQTIIVVSVKGPVHWQWDGDKEKPTLAPSIAKTDGTHSWHGHLIKGEFRTCV